MKTKCDCCGNDNALNNVSHFDSFYEWLCDECYKKWHEDKGWIFEDGDW